VRANFNKFILRNYLNKFIQVSYAWVLISPLYNSAVPSVSILERFYCIVLVPVTPHEPHHPLFLFFSPLWWFYSKQRRHTVSRPYRLRYTCMGCFPGAKKNVTWKFDAISRFIDQALLCFCCLIITNDVFYFKNFLVTRILSSLKNLEVAERLDVHIEQFPAWPI
jgi:hypothetical protein